MTPTKSKTEIFEDVIYYCAIPIDSENLFDKVTRYIQVNLYNFRIGPHIGFKGPLLRVHLTRFQFLIGSKWADLKLSGPIKYGFCSKINFSRIPIC